MSAEVAGPGRGVPLEPALRARRDAGAKLLVTYMTAGLTDDWVDYLQVMVEAGADAVEIGLPFSDPVMDGPTIQEASVQALARGVTPGSALSELAEREQPVPLVAMTYYNLVLRAGLERFAARAASAGVRAAIIPDIPLEESGPWEDAADQVGVATVLLAAPVTPDDRLAAICRRSRGFVYGVNLMGVTGERQSLAGSAGVLAKRLKAVTDLPVVMGFGISTPDQAVEAAAVSDGVVVASALMRKVLDGASVSELGEAVAEIRRALDRG
jgi:tryptophan synthase alpha chain